MQVRTLYVGSDARPLRRTFRSVEVGADDDKDTKINRNDDRDFVDKNCTENQVDFLSKDDT